MLAVRVLICGEQISQFSNLFPGIFPSFVVESLATVASLTDVCEAHVTDVIHFNSGTIRRAWHSSPSAAYRNTGKSHICQVNQR